MDKTPQYINVTRIIFNQQTLYDYQEGKWVHINELPIEDVAPVTHGHWFKEPNVIGWTCSHCKGHIVLNIKLNGNYCPNCGAKMDEVI